MPRPVALRFPMLSVVVAGYVAADPRSSSAGGTDVTNFSVLSNTKIKGEDTVTEVDVAVWGKRAETAAKYIKKGSLVTVAGSGHIVTFERKDGSPGAKIALNASDFTLPPKKSGDDL